MRRLCPHLLLFSKTTSLALLPLFPELTLICQRHTGCYHTSLPSLAKQPFGGSCTRESISYLRITAENGAFPKKICATTSLVVQTPCRSLSKVTETWAKLGQFKARHQTDGFFLLDTMGSAVSPFELQTISHSGFIRVKTIPLPSFGTHKHLIPAQHCQHI